MKVVMLSLLLTSSIAAQACKTCYYYEQMATDNQQEGYSKRHSTCDASSENCSNTTTIEMLEDYYGQDTYYGD